MNITSPVTGMAQPDFTSPTYTLTEDAPPALNGKQWYVSSLGGTQTGVTTHGLSSPFTVSVFRPTTFKTLTQALLAAVGLVDVPRNTYKIIVRKGAAINAFGGNGLNMLRIEYEIAANAPEGAMGIENIEAMFSLGGGVFTQVASQLKDQVSNGTV